MSANILYLVVFVCFCVGVHSLLPRRQQNLWLLGMSLGFCTLWSGRLVLFLLALTLINFVVGQQLPIANLKKRWVLWSGIAANIGMLILFKYTRFFFTDFTGLLADIGLEPTMSFGLQIVVALGLSYVALQGIAYLIDISTGRLEPSRNPIDFALYLVYFPKLVSGPIERAEKFLPQLAARRVINESTLIHSSGLIALGLVRKVVIADSLAVAIPQNGWMVWNGVTVFELGAWLILYAFMLYNDFAGYTDIARGVSRLFGIELSPNFRQPFFSRNLSEYWNRYHITLTAWLRDYIYLPLSRRLQHRPTLILLLPSLATMVVSGLWHGISVNMVLWGVLHGVFLTGERVIAAKRKTSPPSQWSMGWQTVGVFRVFLLTVAAYAFFRIDLLFTLNLFRGPALFEISLLPGIWVLGFILASLAVDWLQHRGENEVVWHRWPRFAQSAALAAAISAVLFVASVNISAPFVYQGF